MSRHRGRVANPDKDRRLKKNRAKAAPAEAKEPGEEPTKSNNLRLRSPIVAKILELLSMERAMSGGQILRELPISRYHYTTIWRMEKRRLIERRDGLFAITADGRLALSAWMEKACAKEAAE